MTGGLERLLGGRSEGISYDLIGWRWRTQSGWKDFIRRLRKVEAMRSGVTDADIAIGR